MAVVFCGFGLKGREKKVLAAETTTKADMSKPETMPSGMQGMMDKGQMMSMCPMHQMIMGSMMSKAIAPTEDGGVIVLAYRISFVEFSRSYYPVYLEMAGGFLTEQEEGFFAIVQEQLDWTVEGPSRDAIECGLMSRAGFLELLDGKTQALRLGCPI